MNVFLMKTLCTHISVGPALIRLRRRCEHAHSPEWFRVPNPRCQNHVLSVCVLFPWDVRCPLCLCPKICDWTNSRSMHTGLFVHLRSPSSSTSKSSALSMSKTSAMVDFLRIYRENKKFLDDAPSTTVSNNNNDARPHFLNTSLRGGSIAALSTNEFSCQWIN